MNRACLLLFVVALCLASGAPADGRCVPRRVRADAGHAGLEADLPTLLLTVAPSLQAPAPALPAGGMPRVAARVVRIGEAGAAACIPAEPATLAARSRAPPRLG